MPTPPDTEGSSNASPDGSINKEQRKRAASPAPSCSTIESSVEVASSNALPNSSTITATQSTAPAAASKSTPGPPPAKRRKLTPEEKLEQAQAKEAKAREAAEKKALKEQQKAEAEAEKARKAEEKARKDEERAEEKARKDEEKRAKAEEREAKKREKELEEERKAQEKLAKERKQMRLGAFFAGKPSTPARSTSGGDEEQPRTRRKSLSLEPPFDALADQIRDSASPSKGTPLSTSAKKPSIGDYKRTFLPFQLPPTGSLAPVPDHSEADQDRFDHELNDPSIQEKYDLGLCQSYANLSNYYEEESKNSRGIPEANIQKIVNALRGLKNELIDLTGEVEDQSGEGLLQKIPVKHIHFDEDVRPDYYGTYTQIRSPRRKRKVSRNPFTRARPDTDYDVDSEAEWEEPEEGDEEIGDEEDDEIDSQADAGEMDDFLDDEDDIKIKRKAVTDSLAPESTGLCWENERGRIRHVDGIDVKEQPEAMSGMRIGFLLPGFVSATIDPFSTSYWEKPAPAPAQPAVTAITDTTTGLMPPPRQPLQPKLNFSGTQPQHDLIGAAEGQKGPITSLAASQVIKRGPKPAPKTLSKEDLEEFKEAVIGSPLGKLELQKGLKSRFPKLTNETIKENLNSLFAQKGAGKTKQWVYVGDSNLTLDLRNGVVTRPPKREAKAAAEVLGTAELLEMILLELSTYLQMNKKVRKRRKTAYNLARLRRVNSFFKNCIDGSTQLLLSTCGKRDVLAPLDWLFKKQLGITVLPTALEDDSHCGKFRLREIDVNFPRNDWKSLLIFDKTQNKQDATWRKIRIARPEDDLREIVIDVSFLGGPFYADRRYRKAFRFRPDDTLSTVFDAFRSKMFEANRKDAELVREVILAPKRKWEELKYLAEKTFSL
ncbi:hypothetical protein AC579_7401 [Pseudocercospora musae]|uniref:Chromatin assembly factor 1 subunit A n=1 Tax=Pseudocercospora musae TaxID=113226 RepID=A0A139IQR0_9PEZI|nr:hypothetical protein AC579_7401 [Pseudocercospora musae]